MTDTAPIRPEERFDEARVAAYLQSVLPDTFGDGEVTFDQFPGGAANLTYRATSPDGLEMVLRRAPLGEVAKGGHDMAREYAVLSRLWLRYPLAPRAFAFCEDPSVMGKPFFVMERRRGHVVRDRWPTSMENDPDLQRQAAESLVDALADLHAVEPESVDLGDLGRPSGFVSRQIEGWSRRWHRAATRPVQDMETASAALSSAIPEPQRVAVLHNDYKLDNTMIDDHGDLVAVFDWDMATLGDPLVDVGTLLAYWAQPDDPTYLVFGANAVAIGLTSQVKIIVGPGSLVEVVEPDVIRVHDGIIKAVAPEGRDVHLQGPDNQQVKLEGTSIYRLDGRSLARLDQLRLGLAGGAPVRVCVA